MKRRMTLVILIFMSFLALNVVNIHAASDVRVFLDGAEVDYSRVKDESGVVVLPQIINNRLMVPIRQTSEIFGIDLVWDPNTNTMTMTKEGVVSVHTIHTNTVKINGVVKQYDTPSMVIEGRTLMPNIMIADIINCDTWWDNSIRSVIMRSRPKAVPKPEVISASTSKPEVMIGEELIITVFANEYTSTVNLVDNSGRVLSSANQYTQNGEYRSFTLRYSPMAQTIAPIQYKVQAGDGTGYNKEATKTILVSVTQGISVISAYASETKPYLNENASLVVTASDGTTRVRLTDKGTNKTYEQTNYTTVSSSTGERKFTFDIKMTEKGDKTFTIEIGTNSFYIADDKTITLTVQNERPSDPITIKEVVWDNKVYSRGDTVTVSVRTSFSAEEVEIYDSYSRSTKTYTTYRDSTNYRTFDVSVRLEQTGTNSFTATAYDHNRKTYSKNFSISTGSTDTGKIIQNVTHTKSGSNYIISIYTNTNTNYVEILDEYGYSYNAYSHTSSSGNQYRWDITVYDYYGTITNLMIRAQTYDYEWEYYSYTIR